MINTGGVSYLDCTVDCVQQMTVEHKIPVASVDGAVCLFIILTKKWSESNNENQQQVLETKYITIKKNILLQLH